MNNHYQVAVVQTGGCSAVINSTLAGIIEELQNQKCKVIGYRNAFEGLFNDEKVDLTSYTKKQIYSLRQTPGAYLGSSRLFLTADIFTAIPQKLQKDGCNVLLMIGGNGTMYAANKILSSAEQQHIPLQVIGIPKTVDNDLVGIEYAPGFGSAASYVAQAVRDIGMDLASMKTFEQVRIVETMGRSAGWLAAAAGLAKIAGCHVPHRIYLPEYPFDEKDFLQNIKTDYATHGYTVVVIGEGIQDKNGRAIGEVPFADLKNGSRIYGGASYYLAKRVQEEFHLRARAIDLSMPQRCFQKARSQKDEMLAYTLGHFAGKAIVEHVSGKMISCQPDGSGEKFLPLSEVAGIEKHVSDKFYNMKTNQVTPAFLSWLQIITGPMTNEYLTLPDKKAKLLRDADK